MLTIKVLAEYPPVSNPDGPKPPTMSTTILETRKVVINRYQSCYELQGEPPEGGLLSCYIVNPDTTNNAPATGFPVGSVVGYRAYIENCSGRTISVVKFD